MTLEKCMACGFTRSSGKPHLANLCGATFSSDPDIDVCLLPELEGLWTDGIETTCSCCGHGVSYDAFIVVPAKYRSMMIERGYEERPPKEDRCTFCGAFFKPKTVASIPSPTIKWYSETEGEKDYMFDVKLVTTTKSTACGPACLKMLLGYYGIDVDLDTLIAECGLGVNGCTAKDMLRVGRAHGMPDFAAFSEAPADVLIQDRPAIIWWRYNHWIVFCGLNDAGNVVICNPSRGRFAIDLESFCSMCAGLEEGTCVALCNGQPEDLPQDVTTT